MASRNGVIPLLAADGIMDGNNPLGLSLELDLLNMHIFGHSLIKYGGGDAAPVSDFTSSIDWLGWLAQENSKDMTAGGNFGQIFDINNDFNNDPAWPTDTNLSPTTNTITPYWDGDFSDFDELTFDRVTFMASNFEQSTLSPAQYAQRVVDLVDNIEGFHPRQLKYYMYVHWPEAASIGGLSLPGTGSLTAQQFADFNNYTVAGYWDWHDQWRDAILAIRSSIDIEMIPAGPIIHQAILNESYMSTFDYQDCYGDASGHGTETYYLLAAIVMYHAIYRARPDFSTWTMPAGASALLPEVASNLVALETYFYNQRSTYVDANNIPV